MIAFLINASKKNLLLIKNKIEEKNPQYANLSFTPVHKCNLQCKYCFAKGGSTYKNDKIEFNNTDIQKTLNFFFNELYPNAKKYRIDFVSGGEPLLSFNSIKKTIEYAEEFHKQSKKNIQIWLCTNGTLLKTKYIRYLDSHKVSIGISIDGERDAHNANRVYPNGKGSYDDTIKGLNKIKSDKQINQKTKHVWGLSVINEQNYNLIKILENYRQIGIASAQLKIEWSENENYDKLNQYILSYESLAEFLLEKFKENDLFYLTMIINDNDQFGKILKRFITGVYCSRRCEAGRYKITICPNGDIYPCYSFVGINEMKLGNINEPNIKLDLLKNYTLENNSKCSSCDIKYLCGGDCFYNSYLNTNNFNNASDFFCKIQRKLCEIGIWLIVEMKKNDQKNTITDCP